MADRNPADGSKQKADSGPERIAAPSPSLPKGGGAIRGIGEKFSANLVTGTGTMAVPIATSPGRSGFHPELSLSYDSGSGNGPFGLGWHLSVPAISRKTEKGLPQYRDAEDSDVFLLSGAEDLVPSLHRVKPGDPWTRDVPVDTPSLRVERYRPRVEGLFARIERWTEKGTGNVYWVAVTQDNVTSTYGKTASARIADPEEPSKIFTWLLEETRDSRGNVIAYEYKTEDLAGVALSLHEKNRQSGAAKASNLYLKRIKYGNTTPYQAGGWLFEVVFDYGEHDLTVPLVSESIGWHARLDPFSSYRAGFEIRTHRLCQRVLMFHHMTELGPGPCLVRSTDFVYDEKTDLSRITAVRQTGYMRAKGASTYTTKSLPPLSLAYSLAQIHPQIQLFDAKSLGGLPAGVDGRQHQWVDLDGEGIPGVLSDEDGALVYRRSLGAATLAPPRVLMQRPTMTALSTGGQQIMDLGGDGRLDLVELAPPLAGYHERVPALDMKASTFPEGGWGPFIAFRFQPNVDWNDPNLRFLDLNGDGFDDIVIAKDNVFVWYPSKGKEGFGPPHTFPRPSDEEKGPALVFADGTQSIYVADLSGDGLGDLVRIGNGEVSYWPNLGYGRFGAKVSMTDAPFFDSPDMFDPRRVRLADIDGSGMVDILYLGGDGICFWLNQAGNSWGKVNRLPSFPSADALSTVAVLDLLGTGTACIVWSSVLPGMPSPVVRYIDLLGSQKPYLLTSVKNNLGLETRMAYAPSTKFYLEDAAAGTPWVTRLHFPVYVLERVESYDAVSRHRFVSLYGYHHGYYDGAEREFRGFGRVERWDWDTGSDAPFHGVTLFPEMPPPVNNQYPQPPVLTRTWFHTGAWEEGQRISTQLRGEYYALDPAGLHVPDSQLPPGLSAQEMREGCRALKGQILREEVYALDGTPAEIHPYSVSERNYALVRVQPVEGNPHAVFFAHPREAIDVHYERDPSDPRVQHAFTLAVDPYGHVTRSGAVGYPRRNPSAQYPEQGALLMTLTEVDVVNRAGALDWYRAGAPVESRTYELTGLAAPSGSKLFAFDDMLAALVAQVIPYEAAPTPGVVEKRLVERARTRYYDSANLPNPLSWGEIDALGMPFESYGLAVTPGLLSKVYDTLVTPAILVEGGYVQLENDPSWWVPSGRQVPGSVGGGGFQASPFYLPVEFLDPFGHPPTTVAYDNPYWLLAKSTTDALGNVVQVENDYRTLSPSLITDPNGNQAAAAFDELGMVIATAVMGKPGKGEGDTLAQPTTTLEYSLDNWWGLGVKGWVPQPNFVRTRARERHGDPATLWQESYSYSDGSGHEIMKKVQAEPEKVQAGSGLNKTPRWVGTGRTVFDNKGNPVKQYEPFFSATPDYETDEALVQSGVTAILRYDPLGRLIRTDLPNGTCSRVDFTPWMQASWDANDTVLDVGNGWYAARQPGANPPLSAAEQRAAVLTAMGGVHAPPHAGTPAVTHFDTLGRAFLAVADSGGGVPPFETRTTLDIEGNPLVITDARKKATMTHDFGVLGQKIHQKSIDAGERWMIANVLGKPLRGWDNQLPSKGYAIRTVYDTLNRPTELWVQTDGGSDVLAERTVYGEQHPNAASVNLLGKVYQQYDGAGVVTHDLYDFKGNPLSGTRQLTQDYKTRHLDWSVDQALEIDVFATTTAYDALNRPTSVTAPDKKKSVIQPGYNKAGLLERVDVWLGTTQTWMIFVDDIDYNEKGQREKIAYGNGVVTDYVYDPLTFRLKQLTTTRNGGTSLLQDLQYTYDPVGNIVEIVDGAQKDVFYNNDLVKAVCQYEYDATYRLMRATGREHAGQNADIQQDAYGFPLINGPNPNDPQALRNYTELYTYDEVGNILQMVHKVLVGTGGWTRVYNIDPNNNRLLSTSLPSAPFFETYGYDAHGNMTSMPHLKSIGWDFKDQKRQVDLGGGGTAYYVYDAGGQRVRKVIERIGVRATVEDRSYLGGYELYRQWVAGVVELERETLHVMDGEKRVALVETKTVDTSVVGVFVPVVRVRYQFGNHLGSAVMEVDEAGAVISYEEYHPYGTTAYQASAGDVEVSAKRYRYTGKEKDEETGLYYHGARYYAAWLGRWTAADPAGSVDGPNLYAYVSGNPVRLHDPSGMDEEDPLRSDAPDGAMQGLLDKKRVYVIYDLPLQFEDGPPAERQVANSPAKPSNQVTRTGPPEELKRELAKYKDVPDLPIDEDAGQAALAAASEPEADVSDSFYHDVAQGLAGIVYGSVQALTPGGFVAPSPAPKSRTFEFFRGAGQTATGLAQVFSGLATITGGGAAAAGGVAGAPFTGGASVLVSVLGGSAVAAGVAAVAQGLVNVGAGVLTLSHAVSMPSSGASSGAVQPGDIVPYRPTTPGLENHHGVLDVWASHNIPGYVSRAAGSPTIALTPEQHAAAGNAYRDWLFERTGKRVGGSVDWTKVSPQEAQDLANRMFDAAKVSEAERSAYFKALHAYIYGR